jgi:hypothetical protein
MVDRYTVGKDAMKRSFTVASIRPARLAATDPNDQIKEEHHRLIVERIGGASPAT